MYESETGRQLTLVMGALVAALSLAVLTGKLAGAPPTALDARAQRLASSLKGGRTVGRIISVPGYPGFYFAVTALLIWWLRTHGRRGDMSLVIASVGGWATHRVIKLFAKRPRPDSMIGRSNELEAFPSGHATATTAIALTVAYVLGRQQLLPLPLATLIAIGIPVAIGAARVLADEHWATDVIGGWIGGTAVAALAALLL